MTAGEAGGVRAPGTPPVVLVMGTSGAGKTTLGSALAEALGWPFVDGDSLHTPHNLAKMAAGIPLTDADRTPWLDRVAATITGWQEREAPGVIACSALKRAYRDRLRRPGVRIVQAWAPAETLRARMMHRPGHFMPADLLDSQLSTLEEPAEEEGVLRVDTRQPLDRAVATVRAWLDC